MSVGNVVQAIRNIPLFAGLEQRQMERLAQAAAIEEIPSGGLYFSEQSAAQGFHLLIEGRVKLFKMSEDGREQTIFIFGPGEPFCLCSVFSDGQIPANLAALAPSRVLVIPPQELERLVTDDPGLLLVLFRVMSRRLKEAMDMIDALSLRQVPARVAAYVLTHAKSETFRLDITQREFAKIIGATPEALSRSLRKMSEAGLIRWDGKEMQLLDLEGLELCRSSGLA